MKRLDQLLQETLSSRLKAEGYDIDLVAVPGAGDRMVRVRTLEEAIEDFEREGDTQGYLVQIRPASAGASASAGPQPFPGVKEESLFSALTDETLHAAGTGASAADPGIYLTDGRLNLPYLSQNAMLLFSAGEYTLARNIYQTLLSSGERSGEAHFWMGRCFEAEGKFDGARKHFEESITFHPTLEAYRHYASLLIRIQKDEEAAEVMERALKLKNLPASERFELHKAAGNSWMRAEKLEPAQDHYLQALALDPAAEGIHASLGALHLQQGRTQEARKHFESALALNSRCEKALSGLGSCAYQENRKREAHDFFARSLEIRLNNPTAVFYLVKCAYELKTYAPAARLLADYIDIAPVNANLLYSLAGLQYHLGRLEQSAATAERILSIQPTHPGAQELVMMISKIATKA